MGRHVLLALETAWHTGQAQSSKQKARGRSLGVPGLSGAGTGVGKTVHTLPQHVSK